MKNANGAKKPENGRRRRKSDTTADWAGADAEILRSAIEAVTKDGGAIRFGYSKDGGAYAVGILGDGKPYTEYLPGAGNLDEWLEGFRDDFE